MMFFIQPITVGHDNFPYKNIRASASDSLHTLCSIIMYGVLCYCINDLQIKTIALTSDFLHNS